MGDVVRAGGVDLRGVEVEGQENPSGCAGHVGRVGLVVGRAWIGESANASIAAEVMIEGAIFLNEDNDVIDVCDLGAGGGCGRGRSTVASTACIEQGTCEACGSGGGCEFYEFATGEWFGGHGKLVFLMSLDADRPTGNREWSDTLPS